MKVLHKIDALRHRLNAHDGVGFVPTMGCLHEGHLSLVRASVNENPLTVVSIFVNPRQFAPGEDLERYPRDLENDCRLLQAEGVDWVFAPGAAEMYPRDFVTRVEQDGLGDWLCGRSRPRHFPGVLTVVARLFGIVRPRRAYFGQKDAQQAVMVKRMVRDLHMGVEIRVLPIVRDSDGLAMSSRNRYLSPAERRNAIRLPLALRAGREAVADGEIDAPAVCRRILAALQESPGIEVEYVEAVSLDDLHPVTRVDPRGTLVAAAVRLGNTRLIDNFILGEI